MIKEWGWRIAAILTFVYLLETLMMPLFESPSDDGLLEHIYNLVLAIFSVWLVSVIALALAHLISIWRFSEQSYRQRVLIVWPVCISGLLLLLVLFIAMGFIVEGFARLNQSNVRILLPIEWEANSGTP